MGRTQPDLVPVLVDLNLEGRAPALAAPALAFPPDLAGPTFTMSVRPELEVGLPESGRPESVRASV
ncbi:hypothetical protein [Deinococcus sp. QL22]|uniref:hypothetical protein n=1 Tax=Deinococcus sp. QL22 TaxID=2939437 RepID=UPI0020178A87|nr:hypothetical protein [Deinococcus sp. QL22]UQN05359.1 hypothetical protein M1R55_10760 [Deinococcus sp. QL22]